MAVSTSITLSQSVSYAPYGVLTVTETSISASANTSTVSYSLVLKRPYEVVSSSSSYTASCTINGTSKSWTGSVGGSGDKTLISGTLTVTHNSDGKKTINLSANINLTGITWSGTPLGNITGSGTLTLTALDRNPTCTHSFSSKTETSITVNWSSDMKCSRLWYSTNPNDSTVYWTEVTLSKAATSGTYTITKTSGSGGTALQEGTQYVIQTCVRSESSGLDGYSTMNAWTTYWYPYANSVPSFNIGDQVTVGLYNPLRRTVKVEVVSGGTTVTGVASTSNTSVVGFNSSGWVDWWYARIPNAKQGTYIIKVTYHDSKGDHSWSSSSNIFKAVQSDCIPTLGTFTYDDENTTTSDITQDTKKIVQGKSKVKYSLSSVTTKHNATISSVKVAVLGKTYTLTAGSGTSYNNNGNGKEIASSSNVNATVTVTDSRGYTASKSVTVSMLPYSNPTAKVSIARQSNYYSETDIKVNASFSSINSKNSLKYLGYRIKKSTDSNWGSWTTIPNNTARTFTADNQYEWNVQVWVEDQLTVVTYSVNLQRGMPLMFWDKKRNSVGVNCFPDYDNSLCLDVRRIYMQNDGETGFTMHRSDYGTSANAYLVGATDGATGFAFRFMKPGDSSWTYSSRICYEGVLPYSNNGSSLGSSTMQWGSIYGKTIYENGTSLESKYAPIVSVALNNDSLGWSNGNTVASGSWVTVGSYNFPVGRYLVMTRVEFASNATGIRQMMWATSNTGTSAWTQQSYSTSPGISGWTNLQSVFYANITTAGSRYLRVYQSSGSALATYVYVQIIGV